MPSPARHMLIAWRGIRPQPQHREDRLVCGVPPCAPWPNQGCAGGFLAEGSDGA